MARISIVVPVYKVESFIRRCVDSILVQTFSDFELILVDDGSPDGCPEICDEYANLDKRVHVIHQKNGGPSAARNAGIEWALENSSSEWIFFVDSDDWIHRSSLEALLKGAEESGLEITICGLEYTDGECPIVDVEHLEIEAWDTEVFFCNHVIESAVAWGKLYKKELFNEIRYPVGRLREDEFVTYKIMFKCNKVGAISQPLYAYYQNPHGIMKSWNVHHFDVLDAFEERIRYFEEIGNKRMRDYSIIQLLDSYYIEIAKSILYGIDIDYDICNRVKSRMKLVRKAYKMEERRYCKVFDRIKFSCLLIIDIRIERFCGVRIFKPIRNFVRKRKV